MDWIDSNEKHPQKSYLTYPQFNVILRLSEATQTLTLLLIATFEGSEKRALNDRICEGEENYAISR